MIIVDTDVIIDWLKDDVKTTNFLEKHKSEIKISIITILEVLDGARNKYEMKVLSDELYKISPIFLDEQICNLARELFVNFKLSIGINKYDALIAATAIIKDAKFLTRNIKHYQKISGIKLISS